MTRGQQTPTRQCVGCGERDRQDRMRRFGLRDGRAAWDPARRAPGRGAYLHPDPRCFARFERRKPFIRALGASLAVAERSRLVSELAAARS